MSDKELLRGSSQTSSIYLKSNFLECFQFALNQYREREIFVFYDNRNHRTSVTFAKLEKDIRAAILQIQRKEAAPQSVVVVLSRNSYEFAVFALATLLSGRTLCPMNPDDHLTRIQKKIAALGEPSTLWHQPEDRIEFAALDGHDMSIDLNFQGHAEFVPFPRDRAMILIFTSGSQGESKIVEQMENSLLTNIDALIERHQLQSRKVLATPLPLFHVNALEFSFLSCLLSGSQFILLESFLLPQVLQVMQDENCQILSVIPVLLRKLWENRGEWKRYQLTSFQYFVSAAAPLSTELVRAIRHDLGRQIIQGYGLSEAINFSCLMPTHLADADFLHWMTSEKSPSIGTPLRGTEVLVLDSHGEVQGEGAPGEICIRGPTVMRGYRGGNSPQVFAHEALHTGDLGYFRQAQNGDKYFFISGRAKEIAKRYGMTVSLREIDEVLSLFAWPEFDAIAVPFANNWAGEEVAIVATDLASWSPALETQLQTHLENQLPSFLRPRLILRTHEALRTPSGKPCRWKFFAAAGAFREAAFGQSLQFVKMEP